MLICFFTCWEGLIVLPRLASNSSAVPATENQANMDEKIFNNIVANYIGKHLKDDFYSKNSKVNLYTQKVTITHHRGNLALNHDDIAIDTEKIIVFKMQALYFREFQSVPLQEWTSEINDVYENLRDHFSTECEMLKCCLDSLEKTRTLL